MALRLTLLLLLLELFSHLLQTFEVLSLILHNKLLALVEAISLQCVLVQDAR